MSETSVPAASGFPLLCVGQSARCEQHHSAMSFHQTNGNNEPARLASRTNLIEVVVVITVLLVWIKCIFNCTIIFICTISVYS